MHGHHSQKEVTPEQAKWTPDECKQYAEENGIEIGKGKGKFARDVVLAEIASLHLYRQGVGTAPAPIVDTEFALNTVLGHPVNLAERFPGKFEEIESPQSREQKMADLRAQLEALEKQVEKRQAEKAEAAKGEVIQTAV
jgi:hypothetical protein